LTWSDVAVASAFVVGVIAGALGAIRLLRYAIDYLRRENQK
jgi:hypothetical protein